MIDSTTFALNFPLPFNPAQYGKPSKLYPYKIRRNMRSRKIIFLLGLGFLLLFRDGTASVLLDFAQVY
jgi:hypothetical protein